MDQPDTKEIEALLAALNRSAERLQTLWFSFLGLTIYFAVAALTVTHRMLLLEEPQALPIINLKVPLLPFFIIAPLFYLVIHFYVLMMLVLLARTSWSFEQRLTATIYNEVDRERFRARCENTLFVQMLVGQSEEREGFNGKLLGAIALITLAVAPVAVLLLMQMMFLPYHSFGITWWHRGMVVADVVLVSVLWTSWRHGWGATPAMGGRSLWRGARDSVRPLISPRSFWYQWLENVRHLFSWTRPLLSAQNLWRNVIEALKARRDRIRLVGVFIAFFLSFYEGRWVGEPWIGRADFEARRAGVVFGLFPDRLNLANETIVGEALFKEKQAEASSGGTKRFVPTRKFDGRNFVGANFAEADLRGVDLQGEHTLLQGANFFSAQLQGVELYRAQLQGANLSGAQLQGVDLVLAQFQGASLSGAQSQGADLTAAQLQGAFLLRAQLQGGELWRAQLQGADLREAQLQGADLSGAQLQGADLTNAQLQGAALDGAQLQGSDLTGAFMFKVDTLNTNVVPSRMRGIRTDSVKRTLGEPFPIKSADIEAWIAAATSNVKGEPSRKKAIIERFLRLRPDAPTAGAKAPALGEWTAWQEISLLLDPRGEIYRRALATILGNVACEADGAPYVARRLAMSDPNGVPYIVRRAAVSDSNFPRLAAVGDQLDSVRNRMKAGRKDPANCPGVVGFTEADWRQLDTLQPSKD